MRVLVIVATALALVSTGVLAQLYRWVDQDGKVNYTQQPPPPSARNVQKKASAAPAAESSALPYATQTAAKNFPVILYTSADCGDACVQARNALVTRTIPFREIAVADQKSVEDLKKLSGKAEVPALRVGTQIQSGFEAIAYKNALDAAGYPASGPRLSIGQLRKEDPKSVPAKVPAEGVAPAEPEQGSAQAPAPEAKK
ncbi:MAG: glutaredoxin family protein [Betaproteobacteria bacterium]|nr:glutaredoxin family protein [Betaproteobacteria bacterium]